MAVKLSAERIERENRIFRLDDVKGMALLIDELAAQTQGYIDEGITRPYHLLDLVDYFMARAVKEEKNQLNAWLMDYKNKAFDFDFIEEAEEDLADFEFEMRDPYLIEKYKPGQKITFGSYPATKYGDKRSIEWRILDIMGDKALLITNGVVECKRFDEGLEPKKWGDCNLRAFLNGQFADITFTDEEKALLETVSLNNPDNQKYGTSGCPDTEDKVFLLSLDEVEQYFANDADRKSIGTDYTKSKSINLGPSGYSWWWLRSPGQSDNWASYVFDDGVIFFYGDYIYNHYGGVRPCICLSLKALDR